jgi:hypothetical protein
MVRPTARSVAFAAGRGGIEVAAAAPRGPGVHGGEIAASGRRFLETVQAEPGGLSRPHGWAQHPW